MSPYDRSFWERMRDPWHWIITAIKALPSTQAIAFGLRAARVPRAAAAAEKKGARRNPGTSR